MRLCRAPGVNRVSYAPVVQTWIFSAISMAAPASAPLLRVSHDYLWVLRDALLWNERDPHAPAGIVSEELSELGQGQLFVVDVNGDLAVRAAVVSNATQHLAARHPLVAIFAALYLLPGGISVTVLSQSSSSRCCAAITPLNTPTISLSVMVFICGQLSAASSGLLGLRTR
jgi:hypothetical protein